MIINLASVSFPGGIPPAEPMTGVIIRYRLTADPDVIGSYTLVTSTAVILTNGNFQDAPIQITGLDPDTSYTVWVKPECGNGFKKAYVTPAASCVDITDITGTTEEEELV